MSITRPAAAGKQKRTYRVDYPINPGETRFDVSYTLPATTELSGKVLETSAPLRLVVPNGVTLTGASLEPLGQEPSTQAVIYNVKGNSFDVQVSGTGTLGQPEAASSDEDTGQPKIAVGRAPSVRQPVHGAGALLRDPDSGVDSAVPPRRAERRPVMQVQCGGPSGRQRMPIL